MDNANQQPELRGTTQTRRRLGTLAGLLLMGASLAASGCDMPEDRGLQDGVVDPGFAPNNQEGVLSLPNPTILIDRSDLLAVAPAGVPFSSQAIADIQDQFRPSSQRALQGKIEVAYLGPISFNHSRHDGARAGSIEVEHLPGYAKLQSLPGHRVMWANFETGNLFLINYPVTSWTEQELPALDEYDPVPTPDPGNAVDSDVDIDWLRVRRYRYDAQGALSGHESRQRVFEPDAPIYGGFYKHLLNLGGATGSMIGMRHFMTAAHVLVQHEGRSGSIKLFDVPVHPARNGNTQIGKSTRINQLWWMADWTDKSWGVKRRGYDMAWGTLDRATGEEIGYFGLMSSSPRSIQSQGLSIHNAGYPDCRSTSAPVPPNCLRRHVYADTQACKVLGATMPDAYGAAQAIVHGCDANRGHGGSPLYVNDYGITYLWGVHSGSLNGINYASRLTPTRQRYLMSEMFARFPRDMP